MRRAALQSTRFCVHSANRDPQRTQAFLSRFGPIRQHFALLRYRMTASTHHVQLQARLLTWQCGTGVNDSIWN
jgi:hypothetical protein